MMWTLARQLGYRHVQELLRDLTTRELCDWLAVNAADPFVAERADLNAARIGQCCIAAMGGEISLADVQLPFGQDVGEDYGALVEHLRERQAELARRQTHGAYS